MKFYSILIPILILIFLSGCGVRPDDYKKAEKVCEPNGGLKAFTVFPFRQIVCNNGLKTESLDDVEVKVD